MQRKKGKGDKNNHVKEENEDKHIEINDRKKGDKNAVKEIKNNIENKEDKKEIKRKKDLDSQDMLLIFSVFIIVFSIAAAIGYSFYQMSTEDPNIEISIKLKSLNFVILNYLSGITENSIFPFNRFFINNFYNRITKENKEEFIEQVRTIDFKIPSHYSGKNSSKISNYEIPARLYVPYKAVSSNTELPLLIWFHGGKFNFGSYSDENSEFICRKFAKEKQIYVISFDYRLAPEYQFPFALEDAYSSLFWLNNKNHPCILGKKYKKDFGNFTICSTQNAIDLSKIFIGGEGSGATLAITSLLLWRDRSSYNIKYEQYNLFPHHHQHQKESLTFIGSILVSPQIFEYPPTESINMDHYFVSNFTTHLLERNYLKEKDISIEEFENSKSKLYKNPYLSPLSANLVTFPPTCLTLTAIDPYYHSGYHFLRLLLDEFHRELKSWRYLSMVPSFLTGDYSKTEEGWSVIFDCFSTILNGDPLY